jgi:hypothetical protein
MARAQLVKHEFRGLRLQIESELAFEEVLRGL